MEINNKIHKNILICMEDILFIYCTSITFQTKNTKPRLQPFKFAKKIYMNILFTIKGRNQIEVLFFVLFDDKLLSIPKSSKLSEESSSKSRLTSILFALGSTCDRALPVDQEDDKTSNSGGVL